MITALVATYINSLKHKEGSFFRKRLVYIRKELCQRLKEKNTQDDFRNEIKEALKKERDSFRKSTDIQKMDG